MLDGMESRPGIKERVQIGQLPPTVFRLFGDVDYLGQLKQIPQKFNGKVQVLTTNDTSSDTVAEIRQAGFEVIQSTRVDSELAKQNASMLLNEAVDYLIHRGHSYAFILSSGYQRQLGMFYSMFKGISERIPSQDVYYFILPETHTGLSMESHKNVDTRDIWTFLSGYFPYETALIMNLKTMPEFETHLSQKGAMGKSAEGIPLGGMEFFITILNHYAGQKKLGNTFSPKMVGITSPVPIRPEFAGKFYRRAGEVPASFSFPQSIKSFEVTTSEDKLSRRLATFQAAMKVLGLSDEDIRKLFINTQFENGLTDILHFNDKNTYFI